MDDVKDRMTSSGGHSFYGLEIELGRTAGARALRVVHPGAQEIAEHRHDWPLLTFPLLGGYDELCDGEVVSLAGPAVILHPPGRCHANCIHSLGMETFSIEFDPAWIGLKPNDPLFQKSFYWVGGSASLAARRLAQSWSARTDDRVLAAATAELLAIAAKQAERSSPSWLAEAQQILRTEEAPTAVEIAGRLQLHPRWLAHAYREATGEGLHETIVRRRCEAAAHLLRTTDQPIAGIAADAGFCDQSHLNRALRRLTGRTPMQIREEREILAALAA